MRRSAREKHTPGNAHRNEHPIYAVDRGLAPVEWCPEGDSDPGHVERWQVVYVRPDACPAEPAGNEGLTMYQQASAASNKVEVGVDRWIVAVSRRNVVWGQEHVGPELVRPGSLG